MAYVPWGNVADWLNNYKNNEGVGYGELGSLVDVFGQDRNQWTMQGGDGTGENPGELLLNPDLYQKFSQYTMTPGELDADANRRYYNVTGPDGYSTKVWEKVEDESWIDKAFPGLLMAGMAAGLGGFLPGTESIFGGAASAGGAAAAEGATGAGMLDMGSYGALDAASQAAVNAGLTGTQGLTLGGGIGGNALGAAAADFASMASGGSGLLYGSPFSTSGTGDLLNAAKTGASSLLKNPSTLLQGATLLGAAGAKPPEYNGPMPNITRGNWKPQVQAQTLDPQQQTGLLNAQGYQNSGLWRFLNGTA